MDMKAKMMTVKGKKGDVTFDVSGAKMKGEMKAGDKVHVKYMEKEGKMMATSLDGSWQEDGKEGDAEGNGAACSYEVRISPIAAGEGIAFSPLVLFVPGMRQG
ncbi:MAG: hypothetical protein ABSC55_25365 [Syntrophorhabdales bacterium]